MVGFLARENGITKTSCLAIPYFCLDEINLNCSTYGVDCIHHHLCKKCGYHFDF
jgi:hypothetical protein